QRMIAEAQQLGANAIICARYASSSVMEGTQEMLAYGTAVRYV
ncbi:MAG: heavy metal-binding domain-containing protein, partial [Eggerthellaceae bacterium]|nr:heavy metal-binding domain-containing protein [Eggerthellaceae bacterium]MBQ9001547.1 heavy metal-binding domain-containing protein [Eggerthellaceae bacterium]